MISALDRLQLRPHEKRLIVMGGLVLFVVLNLWFVWPHYGDLGKARAQLQSSATTLTQYRTELARTNEYLARLELLESDGGGVLDEDKDITLLSTVQTVARESGITPANITPAPRTPRGGTNAFFEQRALTITLSPTPPEPLIRFLVSLATNQVVLRVKELDLKKDGTQTKLQGSLRVVASFQRQPLAPKATPTNARPNPSPRT
jgi:hypothetical protein